jgi:CheY-like chemotaxis protein
VKDTGVGIPVESQSRIFGSFNQADSSMTRKYGGTGLGLSICKKLVEAMGGQIGFHSEEQRGTEFWFQIPYEVGDAKVVEQQSTESRSLPKKKTASYRVLVVEDNPINRKVAMKALGRIGYLVDTVSNGQEAVDAVTSTEYDVVLMDCQMPVMDGYQATTLIRQQEFRSGRRTPIIALTAHAMASDRKKCLDAGMDEYVTKPFDPHQLDKLIESLIRNKKGLVAPTPGASATPVEAGPADVPRVQRETLKELAGLEEDGAAFISELAEMFLDSTPGQIKQMVTANDKEQSEILAGLAHSLKSSSGNLGLMKFHGLCKELEGLAKEKKFKKARTVLTGIKKEFQLTEKALKEEVAFFLNAKRNAA